MSNYEYMTGMGTAEDGITLGPGVSVPPDEPPIGAGNGSDDFVNKLKAEKGPFVYIGKESPEGKKFVNWLFLYDPTFLEWFMKLAFLKMSGAVEDISSIPEWVSGSTIRFRKSIYDLYLEASTRVSRILTEQGKIVSTTISQIEFESFMLWWKRFDVAGVAALISMSVEDAAGPVMPPVEIPKKLFEYWKTTKGQIAPPKPLLGLGTSWVDWALDNWLWLLGGTAGGVLAARWYTGRNKPEDHEVEEV